MIFRHFLKPPLAIGKSPVQRGFRSFVAPKECRCLSSLKGNRGHYLAVLRSFAKGLTFSGFNGKSLSNQRAKGLRYHQRTLQIRRPGVWLSGKCQLSRLSSRRQRHERRDQIWPLSCSWPQQAPRLRIWLRKRRNGTRVGNFSGLVVNYTPFLPFLLERSATIHQPSISFLQPEKATQTKQSLCSLATSKNKNTLKTQGFGRKHHVFPSGTSGEFGLSCEEMEPEARFNRLTMNIKNNTNYPDFYVLFP